MERSRSFYQDAFGWAFLGHRPSGLGLDLTDGVNNVTLLQQPAEWQSPPREEGSENIHFGVIVDDLAACFERLRAWGAPIVRDDIKERNAVDAQRVPTHSFKTLDPDGNIVDVTANPREWPGVLVE